jgi:hypothetical protein
LWYGVQVRTSATASELIKLSPVPYHISNPKAAVTMVMIVATCTANPTNLMNPNYYYVGYVNFNN